MDGLHSSPRTATYCNPTDIVWMPWIEEDNNAQIFYNSTSNDKKILHHTITEIYRNKINGESHIFLPSKKIRKSIDCYEFFGNNLLDAHGKILAFNHKKNDIKFDDRQEIVAVDKSIFEKSLEKQEYEIVWFIELYKEKNPLNKNLDKNFHVRRTRKYFVWNDNNEKKCLNFWDEQFKNQRDKNKS